MRIEVVSPRKDDIVCVVVLDEQAVAIIILATEVSVIWADRSAVAAIWATRLLALLDMLIC